MAVCGPEYSVSCYWGGGRFHPWVEQPGVLIQVGGLQWALKPRSRVRCPTLERPLQGPALFRCKEVVGWVRASWRLILIGS